MQKEKILVTGGAGFIGSHFVDAALAAGYILCDFFTFRLANMAAFSHGTPPEWIMLPVGLALSLAGLLLGRILHRFVSGKD